MKVMNSEIKAMVTLSSRGNSPNVVRLIEIIDDEAGFEDKLIIVMEYCPGGQLLNWDPQTHIFTANPQSEQVDANGNISEATIKKVVREIASGLLYCH